MGFDNTEYIRESISEVQETIYMAFILVVLIIFLFLRDWRTTVIPAIAIPISLIGAFFIMYIFNFTINILTLLAVVLSIGLVVDDAIIMMENIYSKIERGMEPMQAGLEGAAEIFFAVIATTVTLVAVFFPVVFLQGVTGRLFREFSIVIAGAVIISSFVALTLTPMLSTRILKKREKHNKFYRVTEPFFIKLGEVYRNSLDKYLKSKVLTPIILIGSFVIIIFLWLATPSEMAPLEDRSQLRISTTAPEGATFDYTQRYADQLVEVVEETVTEKEAVFAVIGMWNNNAASYTLTLKKPHERTRTQQEIADDLGDKVRELTGARSFVTQQQTFGGRRGGLPVQYVIQAQNLDKLREILPQFMDKVADSDVFQNYDVNLKFTKPELKIHIDREKASLMGVSVQNIAQTLQLTLSGQRLAYYIMNGKQYHIIGELEREDRNKPADISSVYVRSDNGNLVQLDNLIRMEESSTPPQLFRYNRFVSATVSAGLSKGNTMSKGLAEMDRIAKDVLDDTFSTTLAGDSKDFVESSSSLLFAFALALVLIYLVLAAQFESFRDPFIIMLTVPLALVGALVSMWYFNQTMNIFSQIGIIMLIGLVSKNGILMVEFANQRKDTGLSSAAAMREAAAARFRPILMTSLSTILGVLPMAIGAGAGAESRVSMGIAVVGGLTFSSFLTLYVIPSIYIMLTRDKVRVK